jgi:hypothetical protein
MLAAILGLFGVDLEHNIKMFKYHIHDVIEEGSSRFRHELRDAALVGIFVALGALAATATLGVGIAVLYGWLDRYYGSLIALSAVGCTTAVLAAVMFAVAWWRTSRAVPARHRSKPLPPRPAAEPARLNLSIPPPPADASPIDLLTHRFAHRAVAASDEAIDRATELVRDGPRGTMLATLMTAAVIGMLIGRRGLYH